MKVSQNDQIQMQTWFTCGFLMNGTELRSFSYFQILTWIGYSDLQVYIRIWSFWLTFTVLQWMKKNSKNSQFSSFLLRSGYAIFVKIWKWLKLLNSVPFINKWLLNHLYIRIWSSWLTFTVSQGMKANIKISQFSIFLPRPEYPIQVKILKMTKIS